jgi:salicylate hydroxylase
MLQYLAQGACMAIEDAVTLREALRTTGDDIEAGFRLYESKRIVRTARVVLSAREMGRLYHAKGVERQVRNSLWKGRVRRSASTTRSSGSRMTPAGCSS